MARRRSAHKTGPAPKKVAPKKAKKVEEPRKEDECEKEGCERPAVECEDHVDCDPCEDA